MKKMAFVAAAFAAAGVTLFTSTQVLARPALPEEAAEVSQAEVDRAVERHLGVLLRARLRELRAERARTLTLR